MDSQFSGALQNYRVSVAAAESRDCLPTHDSLWVSRDGNDVVEDGVLRKRVEEIISIDGIRLGDLARIAGRNKQTIGAILDELEKLGYVYRATDPTDRRAKLIMPTQRGRQLIQVATEIVAEVESRYTEELGPRRYTQFMQALRIITSRDSGGESD